MASVKETYVSFEFGVKKTAERGTQSQGDRASATISLKQYSYTWPLFYRILKESQEFSLDIYRQGYPLLIYSTYTRI